ncbi:unnamed protein product [Closterium sp. NIES-53]
MGSSRSTANGSSTASGAWGTPQSEEEEPLEEYLARAEKEAKEEWANKEPYDTPIPIGIPPPGPHPPPTTFSFHPTPISNSPNRDSILPYHRYPHSPLPLEFTPVGPFDPTPLPDLGPSTYPGPPPHHLSRPAFTEETTDLEELLQTSPTTNTTPHDFTLAFGSVSHPFRMDSVPNQDGSDPHPAWVDPVPTRDGQDPHHPVWVDPVPTRDGPDPWVDPVPIRDGPDPHPTRVDLVPPGLGS